MSARYTGGLVYNAPGGWSGFFDGAGDYLSVASNAANALGSGDFTIQFWFNLSGTTGIGSSGEIGFIGCGIVTASRYTVRLQGTSTRVLSWWLNTPSNNVTGTTPIALNTWYHIAWVRSGSGSNNVKLYLNGVLESQGTSTYNSPADTILIGRTYTNLDGEYTNGYLSNMQIVVGTALYTGNFTPPVGALAPVTNTALLTCRYPTFVDGSTNNFTITVNGSTAVSTVNPFQTSQLPNPALGGAGNGVYTMSQYAALKAANLWPAYDPYYKNVTLNLHGDGTNAAQNNTFLDSSTNNFTITRNGNTTQGTFTPYGSTWSNYFDGSGDYLSFSGGTPNTLGTNSSTIEFWMYATANDGYRRIITSNNGGFATGDFIIRFNNGGFWAGDVSSLISLSYVPNTNQWYHVAWVGVGGTSQTLYLNGVAVGTAGSYNLTNPLLYIGGYYTVSGEYFAGYLSNVRVVKGTAVYTANFTPPTAPLTAITNTSLLTCQANRLIDSSTNALAITRNGDTSVQRFNPFVSNYYQSGVIGGSGYFDGSGDYLSVASNDAFRVDQGDWTIEGWVYITSTGSNFTLANRGVYVSVYSFYCGSSGTSLYYEAGTGGWAATGYTSSSGALVAGQWNHIAYVRSGTSLYMYSNGNRVFSQVVASVGANVTAPMWVGQYLGGSAGLNGNMTDFRFVKGTAVYTGATYTVPTAPLTAITNTSLLLSYTNAGIIDNAMMNDLETVGNAQISTSVKKYGTGSMYFDGTGDWLFMPKTADMVIPSSSTFTIECWAYLTAAQNTFRMLVSEVNGNSSRYLSINSAGIEAQFGGTSGTVVAANYTFNQNTWHHIALVRNGTTASIYINGQAQSVSNPTQTNAFFDVGTGMYVGRWGGSPSYEWSGYIDDLRITKGVARYTANFTPPTSQLQDQ